MAIAGKLSIFFNRRHIFKHSNMLVFGGVPNYFSHHTMVFPRWRVEKLANVFKDSDGNQW